MRPGFDSILTLVRACEIHTSPISYLRAESWAEHTAPKRGSATFAGGRNAKFEKARFLAFWSRVGQSTARFYPVSRRSFPLSILFFTGIGFLNSVCSQAFSERRRLSLFALSSSGFVVALVTDLLLLAFRFDKRVDLYARFLMMRSPCVPKGRARGCENALAEVW